MTDKNPIYLVTHKPSGEKRLVRADSKFGAFRHVARDTIEVRRPTQDELIELSTGENAKKVEEAAS